MKLSEATYFPDAKELTRHGFVSHMEDFIGKLIGDNPLSADVDDYLKGFDIDAKRALELLTKPEDETRPETAVVMRTERIKNGGYDEDGKPMKDEFQVIYKVPKKNPELGIKGIDEKLRNMYIKLFENHMIKSTILEDDCGGDGCFGGDIGGNDGSSSFSLGAGGSYPFYDKSFGVVRKQKSIYTPKTKKNESKIRRTMYITEEQMKQLEQLIKEEAEMDTRFGNFGYDAPGFKTSGKDFFKVANDREDILSRKNPDNKAVGDKSLEEGDSGIHIKKSHEGKFTALKKKTGKSASWYKKNGTPEQKKMATFELNARKWKHE
jgi:hypothetical protein